MKDDVIILVGDADYLLRMKALAVNCRQHGAWTGDICFVLAPGAEFAAPYLQARGIYTLQSPRDSYYAKYAIFNEYFRGWRRAFYTDCDALFQRPAAPLFDIELSKPIMMDLQRDCTFEFDFTHWDEKGAMAAHPELARYVFEKRNPKDRTYISAAILFEPDRLPATTEQELYALHDKLKPINTHVIHGGDQPIINLQLYEQIMPVPDRLFCYWSENSDGAPPTVHVHYCSDYAPWIIKRPGMDAYANPVIGLPGHVIYPQLLRDFDTVFPRL